MSRLDYITIAIVAACILAIIFLVYKMTDLFNEKPATDPIENEVSQVEEEPEDTTYHYDIDKGSSEDGEATTDTESTTSADENSTSGTDGSSTDANTSDEDESTSSSPPPTTSYDSNSSGKFMVIAGTFQQKASAKRQLQKLKNLGYSDAAIEPFDRGKYDVVLAGRFDNMADAERLVKDLKAEEISSYVKIKERSR